MDAAADRWPSDITRRSVGYRILRLDDIARRYGGVGPLVETLGDTVSAFKAWGWDDESIAFWLTHENGYLDGRLPVDVWRSGDVKDRAAFLHAASQRASA